MLCNLISGSLILDRLWFCPGSQLGGGFEEARPPAPGTLHGVARNPTPPSLSSTSLKPQLLRFISSPTPFHVVPTPSVVAAAPSASMHHHLETQTHTAGRWSSRPSCLFVRCHAEALPVWQPRWREAQRRRLEDSDSQSSREADVSSSHQRKNSQERGLHRAGAMAGGGLLRRGDHWS